VLLWVMAAAVVFVGCSSTANPAGSGGSGAGGAAGLGGMNGTGIGGLTGAGGAGTGGREVVDAHSPDDAGDAGNRCAGGEPCHTNADCCGYQWCVINAVITDCASAPAGVCKSPQGGTCLTHANICDCVGGSTLCTSFPGTQCHSLANTHAAPDDCFSCVAP
jgi:hypothetical protein